MQGRFQFWSLSQQERQLPGERRVEPFKLIDKIVPGLHQTRMFRIALYEEHPELHDIYVAKIYTPGEDFDKVQMMFNHFNESDKRLGPTFAIDSVLLPQKSTFSSRTNTYYIITKAATGGSLDDYIKPGVNWREFETSHILNCIVPALIRLHQQGIIHNALSPDHILITSKEFGHVQFHLAGMEHSINIRIPNWQGVLLHTTPITPFTAPEIREQRRELLSFSLDVYSLGALLKQLVDNECADSVASQELLLLINRCLEQDPSMRPTLEQIKDHPFVIHTEDWFRSYPDFTKEYTKIKDIKKGGFGEVIKCLHNKTQRNVAIKFINIKAYQKEPKLMELLQHEVAIMYKLRHYPFVIEYIDSFRTDDSYVIVTEFVEGGALISRITLKPNEVALILWNVAKALSELHKRNIVHRDINPDNILLVVDNAGNILEGKLADFGTSRECRSRIQGLTEIGTPFFRAPEVGKGVYNEKVDVFGFGQLMLMLLEKVDTKMPGLSDYLAKSKDLIQACTRQEESQRPSMEEVLRHPWMSYTETIIPFVNPIPYTVRSGCLEHSRYYQVSPCFKPRAEGDPYALVICDNKSQSWEEAKIKRCIHAWSRIRNCPYIAKLIDYFKDSSHFYFVRELCDSDSLASLVESDKLPKDAAPIIAVQLALSLEAMHKRDLVHINLNPNTVKVRSRDEDTDPIRIAVTGFESSRFRDASADTVSAADEIYRLAINSPIGQRKASFEQDIWSYGMILYYLVYRKHPKELNSQKSIERSGIKFPEPAQVSGLPEDSSSFLQNLIKDCVEKRISISEILHLLRKEYPHLL